MTDETETLTPDDWGVIRRADLFSRVPEATVRKMLDGATVTAHQRNDEVCVWGAPAEACYIVIDGLVKVYRNGEDGSMAVLAIHGAGRTLMMAEGLIGSVYSATVETIGPGRIVRLGASALRQRIGEDSRLAMMLLASAASELRMLIAHIEELKTMTGPARLAHMILNLAGVRSGSAQVVLPYEKQLIANRLGMTPESFSRAMGQLKAYGVTASRDRLTIRDVGRLRAFATPDI